MIVYKSLCEEHNDFFHAEVQFCKNKRQFGTFLTKNKTKGEKHMRNKKVLFLTQAAVIAAIYVVLTIFISAFNLASGAIQVRISEALTILPFFTPAAIPGLAIGCLLSNLLTGAAVYDVVFGSLATLLGAVGTSLRGNISFCARFLR